MAAGGAAPPSKKDAAMEDADKATSKKKDSKKKDAKDEDELSEEDAALKADLELMVERLSTAPAPGAEDVRPAALEMVRAAIRSATASMTSVPKPLKFLRPHYGALKGVYESLAAGDLKRSLADVMSVLAMTMAEEGTLESLVYKLAGDRDDLGSWGHEYVRNLAGEVAAAYAAKQAAAAAAADAGADADAEESPAAKVDGEALMGLVRKIVPFDMAHYAEPDAVDLLMEVEQLELLKEYVTDDSYSRACMYLVSCAAYVPEPDDALCLRTALDIYAARGRRCEALALAMRLNDPPKCQELVLAAADPIERRQLGYIVARQGAPLTIDEDCEGLGDDERDRLMEVVGNAKLSETYLSLARDLDVMEPKSPEDIYKAHLIDGRQPSAATVDSARANLAATFVNAFVNCGYGQDKLMTAPAGGGEGGGAGGGGDGGSNAGGNVSWLYKNKDHGKMSAAASLGLVCLWDVEGGLPQIDKYLYSTDPHVVAGALLAVGVVNAGVRDECDPAFALLYESVTKDNPQVRVGAILGLGLAYCSANKPEVLELLSGVVGDSGAPMEVASMAALALGLVYVGSCDEEASTAISMAMMERSESELSEPVARFMCLGLGLLYLNKQDAVEPTLEVAKAIDGKVSKYLQATLDTCAYAGSGSVLKVQQFLRSCSEHLDEDAAKEDGWHQAVCALGVALVASGEELGAQMAQRSLEHMLQYSEVNLRRAVPVALAMLSISNPQMTICDTLSRLSHDGDPEVAQAAILGLGLVSCGTNNARVAGMLRTLSSYCYKDAPALFMVRLAQGLCHAGKGLVSAAPFRTPGLLCPAAMAGLLVVAHSALDVKATLGGRHHYLLFSLCVALAPRMLVTVDEDGAPCPAPVRVGQAVDVVGQAGRPKSITGFQTHTTPVLLGAGERAELATDKYIAAAPVLEGVVILKKNPDYEEDEAAK